MIKEFTITVKSPEGEEFNFDFTLQEKKYGFRWNRLERENPHRMGHIYNQSELDEAVKDILNIKFKEEVI